MKKQFFTFLMMIALVIVAGKAMAANTKYTPFIGSKFTYQVSSTTNLDEVNFYVTLDNVSNPTGSGQAVGVASAVITSGDLVRAYRAFVSTGAAISVEVEWKAMPSSGTTYLLWVQAKAPGASGCSNWRHMVITPLDYVVDFVVTAYGRDATFNGGVPLTAGATDIDECWPVLSDTEVDAGNTTLTETATTKLYFSVTRQAYNTPSAPVADATITNAWEFIPTLTGEASTTVKFGFTTATVEANNGASGTKVELTDAQGNIVYFSVEIPLNQIADRTIAMGIGATALDVNGKTDDNGTTASTLAAANSASVDVSRLPQIGAFE
jgi:hypothetical protein